LAGPALAQQTQGDFAEFTALIQFELVPPAVAEWKEFLTQDAWEFIPQGQAARETDMLGEQHRKAVKETEVAIVSTTIVDDHALVVARVNLVYHAQAGAEVPRDYRDTLRFYEFRRERGAWRGAGPSLPYARESFLKRLSEALPAK
jgi:hypothetical protein